MPTASLQPLAVLLSTLAGYAGEWAGPLLAGTLKDRVAPHCAVISAAGEQIVDPRCANSAADQRGLLMVIASIQIMSLIGAVCWVLGALVTKDKSKLLL